MKANPGGAIGPEDVVGRSGFVKRLWGTLDHQSVVLVAERRIGKTCVIKKMQAEEPAGVLTFRRDVENLETPLEFVERVYHDVEKHLSLKKRTAEKARRLMREIAGVEVSGVVKLPKAIDAHWKLLLETTFEDLTEQQDRKVVFFWDEFPWMLQKIKKTSGEAAAMEILDTLRHLRQTHTGIRMVFTGSIGLHHVSSALTEAGHTHDPLNDMRTIEVPPLPEADARFLAVELLRGEELVCTDSDGTAQRIAAETDCNPYYIHSVVATLKDRGDVADAQRVEQVVAEALVDPQDRWHLQHYRDRLADYYGTDRIPVVLAVLDQVATANTTVQFDDIVRILGAHISRENGETARRILDGDHEVLRRVLLLLQRDHYLHQDSAEGAYAFRFPLIRRWWRLHRNLPT